MADITLTSAMRTNLLSLQGTSRLMDSTQGRISTGLKVATALDNPTAYFTAKNLTNAAADLSTLKDSMGQGISTIEAADKALTSITSLVDQMKGLAASALAASTAAERASLATQYATLRSQIDDLASDATYGGKNLIAGRGVISGGTWTDTVTTVDAMTQVSGTAISGSDDQEFSAAMTVQGVWNTGTIDDLVLSQVTDTTTLLGADDVNGRVLTISTEGNSDRTGTIIATTNATSDALTLTDGTNTASITLAALNAVAVAGSTSVTLGDLTVTFAVTTGGGTDATDFSFTASQSQAIVKNANDSFSMKTTAFGTTTNTAMADGANSITNAAWGGATIDITVGTAASMVVGETATATRTNAGGTGENDMKVYFNADSTAFVNTTAVDVTAVGLGISAAANSWASDSDIEAAVAELRAATATLRTNAQALSTNLGIIQTREDFTKEFINVLQAGGDKLTLADANEEAANMLALQTRQQLGIQSLSMASQAAQSVLSLFR